MSKKRKIQPSRNDWDVSLDPAFIEDLVYWANCDRKLLARTIAIVQAVAKDPFRGIGKPEPLKNLGSGMWSRRLNQEHRIVYWVGDRKVKFLQARYHY